VTPRAVLQAALRTLRVTLRDIEAFSGYYLACKSKEKAPFPYFIDDFVRHLAGSLHDHDGAGHAFGFPQKILRQESI